MLLNQFLELQDSLDRLFGSDFYQKTTYSRRLFPSVNVFEKGDQLILTAEIPGVEKEDLKIETQGDTITFSGSRKIKDENEFSYHRRERSAGHFNRQFKLPYAVNPEKVRAELSDGILAIFMEKHEMSKPKTITIN